MPYVKYTAKVLKVEEIENCYRLTMFDDIGNHRLIMVTKSKELLDFVHGCLEQWVSDEKWLEEHEPKVEELDYSYMK